MQLDSVIKGEGQYKIIGKPVTAAALAAAKKADADSDDDDQ
jgi:hypothetical protein